MPKKRDTEGTIRQRPDGTWEARYTAGYKPDGKQIQKSVYGKTEREVQRKLRSALVDVERGEIGTVTGSVGEWLDEWMVKYKQRKLKPQTYAQHRRIVDQHIIPAIGHLQMTKVNVKHIQKYINFLQEDGARKDDRSGGLSKAYIEKIRNILHDAFDQALINGDINRNPVTGVEMPQDEKKEMRVLTLDEQKRFVDALDEERLRPLFMLALTTGMRRGELLGLTWECVDFKRNEILVMRSTTRYKDPVTGKPVHKLTSPKTFTSRRRIPIMKSMIPILKQHMNDQRLLAVSPDWNPDNLVFCSSKGTLLEANTVNRNLARVIKNAELEDFSMHTLRHTFATRMLEKGVPAKVVQELLGHTDVTLTLNTYSHVLPSIAHDEMAKLEELFTENDSPRSDPKRIPATQQR